MVYKCINNQAPEYLKYMLLRQDTDPDNKTKQDYDRKGFSKTPVEKLRYKCRILRYAASVVRNGLVRIVREIYVLIYLKLG